MRSSWARQKSLWRGGDRRVSAAPTNPIPDAANLRGYMEGDNLDGANNSTLTGGVGVASVVNLGTLGGTFDQGTVANQPLFSTTAGPGGTKPALVFDGTDSLSSSLAASDWTFLHDGTGATIYTIQSTTNGATAGTIVATGTNNATSRGIAHRHNTTFRASYVMSDGVGTQVNVNSANNALSTGLFDLFTSTLSTGGGLVLHVNGTQVMTGSPGAFSALAPASSLVIGANPVGANPFTGAIRRILVFQAIHDATMRAAVLAWSQTLDAVTYPAP